MLADAPDLVKELSRVLAERQTMLDEHADALSVDDLERQMNMKSLQFLDRIKNRKALAFFERIFSWGSSKSFNDVDLSVMKTVQESEAYCRK